MRVEQLSIGMFVAELDCPWSQSPFLIEGFRIDTADELELIRRLCRDVIVDTFRSVGMDGDAADDDGGTRTAAASGIHASSDALAQAALDRNARLINRAGAGATSGDDPVRDGSLHDRRLGWRWIGDVVSEVLQSYLRPRRPSVHDLPAPDIQPAARRMTTDVEPAADPAFWSRMTREVLARPSPPASAPAPQQPAQPRQDVPMIADTRAAPTDLWTRLTTTLAELTAKKRTTSADRVDARTFAATQEPRFKVGTSDDTPRGGPPISSLLKRALRKLFGTAPPDPVANVVQSRQSVNDLSEEERQTSVVATARFAQEIPKAAQVLKQSMDALHLNYARAECDVSLALELLRPWVTEIVDSVLRSENAIVWLARLESHDVAAHKRGLQAAVYMAQFGAHLGMPHEEIEKLALGGALLDIGKMRVSNDILKKPGPLDFSERQQARAHVEIAVRMLDDSGINDMRVRETVERHHEREDGSGYPQGLSGDAIGVYGRIAGIVDTFLALSGERPYAPRAPIDTCLRLLLQGRGTLFHAPLVEHFIQMIGVYPVGSLVELSTGEVAAVLSHNRVRRLRPRVLIIAGSDGKPLTQPTTLDLLYCPRDSAGDVVSIVKGLPFGHHGINTEQLFAATVQ